MGILGGKRKKLFCVLSIDGGGIRGVIPARILEEIERRTGKPISEMFQLIAGSSTGGLIGLALACPDPTDVTRPRYAAREVAELYHKHGEEIFPRSPWGRVRNIFSPRYDHKPLEGVLKKYFGDARVKQALSNVLVPAYDMERRDSIFMKQRKGHPKADSDPDFYMRDVARATSAAPTYFAPAEIFSVPPAPGVARKPVDPQRYSLIDGGIIANNPSTCAFFEALKLAPPDAEIMMVSLGTGHHTRSYPQKDTKDWGALEWLDPTKGLPLIGALMDAQATAADHHMKMAVRDGLYFRIDSPLKGDDMQTPGPNDEMDDASKDNMRRLEAFATKMIRDNDVAIAQLCDILKTGKIPPSANNGWDPARQSRPMDDPRDLNPGKGDMPKPEDFPAPIEPADEKPPEDRKPDAPEVKRRRLPFAAKRKGAAQPAPRRHKPATGRKPVLEG